MGNVPDGIQIVKLVALFGKLRNLQKVEPYWRSMSMRGGLGEYSLASHAAGILGSLHVADDGLSASCFCHSFPVTMDSFPGAIIQSKVFFLEVALAMVT